MKRTRLLLAGALCLSLESMAQQLSPSVLAVSGGTARTPTMVLDWTVGESVVETVTASDRLYTQGFHQPLLLVSEQPNLSDADAGYKFTVAPNPVVSSLRIDITAPESGQLQLLMTDLRGHQFNLPVVPANTTSMQIDMTAYPAGTYLLRIGKPDGPQLKSYKIVKAQ